MKNYVQRIVDVRPTLVLVEKTVSRIAQDMLLEHGITLVINVKSVSFPFFFLFFCHFKSQLLSVCEHAVGMRGSPSISLLHCMCVKSGTGGLSATSVFQAGESWAGRQCA